MHKATKGDDVGTPGKYSFEVGPSIFEGLDKPSLNPLRILMDMLGEEMPVKTYTGLGYWTPEGYWRFGVGSKQKFENLLMERAEDGPLAVKEWRNLQQRLKTLGGSTLAVSLLNLRQVTVAILLTLAHLVMCRS